MTPKLRFDPELHAYYADSVRFKSVTTILRDCGLSGQYRFDDPIHSYRGLAVHSGAAILIAGGKPRLDPLQPPHDKQENYIRVHADIPFYWEAVREAKAAIGFTGAIHECRWIDPVNQFAGTFDMGAYARNGAEQLWEFKSGTFPVLTVIQLCAYEELARKGQPIDPQHPGLPWLQELVRSGRPFERCGLRVEKTGRYTAYYECPKGRPYSDPMWMTAWRSCLFLHRNVPAHEVTEYDAWGHPHRHSRLSDMKWLMGAIAQLPEPVHGRAMRAAENVFNLREAYALL